MDKRIPRLKGTQTSMLARNILGTISMTNSSFEAPFGIWKRSGTTWVNGGYLRHDGAINCEQTQLNIISFTGISWVSTTFSYFESWRFDFGEFESMSIQSNWRSEWNIELHSTRSLYSLQANQLIAYNWRRHLNWKLQTDQNLIENGL